MNIPNPITLKWLRGKATETIDVHGHKLNINAHLLAVQNRMTLVRDATARWHVAAIKGSAAINTLQILCLVGNREDLNCLHLWVWRSVRFLTSNIPGTKRTPLAWLASRNLLDLVPWESRPPQPWVDHLPTLRAAARDFAKHAGSWVNDQQFGYTALLEFIEKVEDEHAVRSLTPANCVRLLPLLRYVNRHGYIPKCDELIEKTEKLAMVKGRENIKLDTDES